MKIALKGSDNRKFQNCIDEKQNKMTYCHCFLSLEKSTVPLKVPYKISNEIRRNQ